MGTRSSFIKFEYVSRDERYGTAKIIFIDSKKIVVKGVSTRILFDSNSQRYYEMTGLFVEYENVEYGTISMSPDELFNLIECACGNTIKRRIHVHQFTIQFQ